jgi:glucokinase
VDETTVSAAPPTGPRTLGIDLGGTAIKWAQLDGGHARERGRTDTPKGGCDEVVAEMIEIAARFGDLDAVGVGVPGLYEPDGTTTLIPNVPGDWPGYPLGPRLAERLGVPVRLANDARAFTLAELRLGAGRGCRDIVAITLGTGVGGGVASNGRLHLGRRQRAGELGHQTVDPQGPRCGCGSRGCVETFASGPAIVTGAVRAVLQGVPTCLREACGGDPSRLDVETVVACARDGDDFALDVLRRAARALGHGLANACTILAPERIVIGGGIAAALDVLRPTIDEVIRDRARLADPPEVVAAELGGHAGAVGAALWSIEGQEEPT